MGQRRIESPFSVKVLIVKLSSLGDVVHAMPAVQDLRRAFAGAQIDWVVERALVPLVARCDGVRRVIACEQGRWRKVPFSKATRTQWAAFRSELRQEAYDAVIDLQGSAKSALVSWLARTAPRARRYGLVNPTDGSSFEAPARWVADVAIELEPHVHAVERARVLCAAAFKYETNGAARFGLKPGALAVPLPPVVRHGHVANPFAARRPMVALVHGTARAEQQWPVASWVVLGQRLNHSGFAVALAHGNAAEKATSEAIASQLDDVWVWPTMGLDALIDTMARCAGVLGVDNGLSHIAVALGLPHVQIYKLDTAPQPDVDAVWSAWESLATPVLCR